MAGVGAGGEALVALVIPGGVEGVVPLWGSGGVTLGSCHDLRRGDQVQ